MVNLAKGIKETLPDFQKFLLEHSLAAEKNVPFLAYWVSRFLTFGRKKDISTDDYNEAAVIEFLDMLRADQKILDWQPRQADDALKLYYFHYLGKAGPVLPGQKWCQVPFRIKGTTKERYLTPFTRGKIIVVFGACGERNPEKRPQMGEIIDRNADYIVVTNDDPYGENPEKIARDLIEGIKDKIQEESLWKILDRKLAIEKAVSLAKKDDIVLILGKGAEQWQVFENKRIPWSDSEITKEIIGAGRSHR